MVTSVYIEEGEGGLLGPSSNGIRNEDGDVNIFVAEGRRGCTKGGLKLCPMVAVVFSIVVA